MPSTEITIYYLQMLDRGAFCPKAGPAGFEARLVDPPDPEVNRGFYRRVGAAFEWTDRLVWTAADWRRYVERAALRTWVGSLDGVSAGYFELETQEEGDVQIAYFGLAPEFIGRGLGGALLSAAIERAWETAGARRVWVHTCSNDHEHALGNYRGRGFEVFKTERVEKEG